MGVYFLRTAEGASASSEYGSHHLLHFLVDFVRSVFHGDLEGQIDDRPFNVSVRPYHADGQLQGHESHGSVGGQLHRLGQRYVHAPLGPCRKKRRGMWIVEL